MSASATVDEQYPSPVRIALANGREALKNAKLPGPLGFFINPISGNIVDPSLGVTSQLLPAITAVIPFADTVVAAGIGIPFEAIRFGYGLLPFREDQDVADMREVATNNFTVDTEANSLLLPTVTKEPSSPVSLFRATIAFGMSATVDIVGALLNPLKVFRWTDAIVQFMSYASMSGVGGGLVDGLVKPALGGRLLDNLSILHQVQEENDHEIRQNVKENSTAKIRVEVKEGKRMMRFATAAYGTDMIKSALDRDATRRDLRYEKRSIAFHTGVKEEDIIILDVRDGGNLKLLRHYVAVDRETQSIVLAIRGTLSVSGVLVDMQGMDGDFCSGKAHAGMAEMAENLWRASGDKIKQLFEKDEFKAYGFTITGHSLGAGTACLLNIKCHVENLVGKRAVRCFGFASPPVFCLHDPNPNEPQRNSSIKASIERAISNCVCYIHNNDCVPFLSVVAVDRLAGLLEAVDEKTDDMFLLTRVKVALGEKKVPQELVEGVIQARDAPQRPIEGASRLTIPAKVVVWAYKNSAGNIVGVGCHPNDLADLSIFVSVDMLADHMPEFYEDSLDALALN